LKQEKEEVQEQLQVAQKEKNEIWAKFEENNAKIQEELESTEMQVGKLVEAIQ
jgi:hypothetical protein